MVLSSLRQVNPGISFESLLGPALPNGFASGIHWKAAKCQTGQQLPQICRRCAAMCVGGDCDVLVRRTNHSSGAINRAFMDRVSR